MSVDAQSPVDATALPLCLPAEQERAPEVAVELDSSAGIQFGAEVPPAGADDLFRARAGRDLNRARVRRLIVQLRHIQANLLNQPAEGNDAAKERDRSSLDENDPAQSATSSSIRDAAQERAKLEAMRALSRWNTKRLLRAHFRRNLVQMTLSKGTIAPLALLAGAGLVAVSQTSWPQAIYAAIVCFSISLVWGGRYLAAIVAPLRHRWLLRKIEEPATIAVDIEDHERGDIYADFDSPTDHFTVAELMAEMRPEAFPVEPEIKPAVE